MGEMQSVQGAATEAELTSLTGMVDIRPATTACVIFLTRNAIESIFPSETKEPMQMHFMLMIAPKPRRQ